MMFIAATLLILHSTEGHVIRVNPEQITSLREAVPGKPNQLFAQEVKCMVGLTDGKFVNVVEKCADIQKTLEGLK